MVLVFGTFKRLLRLIFCHRTLNQAGKPFTANQFLLTCAPTEEEIKNKSDYRQKKEHKHPGHCFNRITIIKHHYHNSANDNYKVKQVKGNSKYLIEYAPFYHSSDLHISKHIKKIPTYNNIDWEKILLCLF